jgi:hypothetical protein
MELAKPYQNDLLDEHVECIRICEPMRREEDDPGYLNPQNAELDMYLFQLNEDEAFDEMDDQEDLVMSHQWLLPSRELHGLWDA